MKSLYTSIVFLMGLFSSNEWFQFYPEVSSPPKPEKEYQCSRSSFTPCKVVLIVKEICPVKNNKAEGVDLFATDQEAASHALTYEVLWPVVTDQVHVELPGKESDTVLIRINFLSRMK